jgi:hypothetical protein
LSVIRRGLAATSKPKMETPPLRTTGPPKSKTSLAKGNISNEKNTLSRPASTPRLEKTQAEPDLKGGSGLKTVEFAARTKIG